MKPTITVKNFIVPEALQAFMEYAIGEILKVAPYDSHIDAVVSKERTSYLMTINIFYPEGKFTSVAQNSDLKKTVTQGTADIFTQVRGWWKSRFSQKDKEASRTDWAGDFHRGDMGQFAEEFQPATNFTSGSPSPGQQDKKPLRVLVVDDDVESVTPLELCLEKLGCETFIVNNGYEAIHEMISSDRVYDVVILDWNMPGMNGGQALINAQKVIIHAPTAVSHWDEEKLPIITYSSKARNEIEIPNCAGFEHIGHWEKPISFLQLLNQATETFAKINAN